MEVKRVNDFNTFLVAGYNSTTQVPISIIPITPYAGYNEIGQGVGQDQRIGNKIRTVKAMVSFSMWPEPYDAINNATPSPQDIMIFILSNKVNNTVRPTSLPTFVQNGTADQSLTAALQDLTDVKMGFNRDLYTIHKVIHKKLGYSSWPMGNPGFAANTANSPNNDYHLNQSISIDVTKYCPKDITYQDTNNSPTSRMVYFYIQAVPANGFVQGTTALPVETYSRIDYWYTDA
jgi:hypothetical protein